MYDPSNMARHSSYSYPSQYDVSHQAQKQYPAAHSTSSAFSASANPNEDWTKISDLAERRRIQNRIAQRNYRKKLKKRLEDLERRAGSSSASPEQRAAELARPDLSLYSEPGVSRQRSTSNQTQGNRTPELLAQHYALPHDDRNMFSQQNTRQLSTSPPPFSYAAISSNETAGYGSYTGSNHYCNIPPNVGHPIYPNYIPPAHQTYAGMVTPPIKQELYGDEEMNPFCMSYASISGGESIPPHTYQDATVYAPSLSDSLDHSRVESSSESSVYPHTPASMPRTPPMRLYD